jgi:hypothetical protein
VLFIATDMGPEAKANTNTYLQSLGVAGMPFLQQVDWWAQSPDRTSPPFQLNLRHLIQLMDHLETMQAMNTPVRAVIIDSMKAVCPEHLLVGQQAFKDYLRLVYDICNRFGAAVIWVHHSTSDGQAQGIKRIIEGASGVIRMERKKPGDPIIVHVEKLRAGGRARSLIIDPFAQHKPRCLGPANEAGELAEEDEGPVRTNTDHRRRIIIDALHRHYAAFLQEHPDYTGAQVALVYRGISKQELLEMTGLELNRSVQRDLDTLKDNGEIQRLGITRNQTYRIPLDDAGQITLIDPFTAG